MNKDREREVAWAAGLFEGEGSISTGHISKGQKGGHWYVTVELGMTDRDVIERFATIVGIGRIREVAPRMPHHKTKYLWKVSAARDVEAVLHLLYPHLGIRRRERADEALRNAAKIGVLPETCPKGHNAWAYWGKGRRCRVCNSIWATEAQRRKRLALG